MEFVRYTEWNQLPKSVDALFVQGEKDSIFLSRPWFESVTTALDSDHRVVLACVVDGDAVMAILPLVEHTGNRKALYSLRHGFSPIFSPLLANDNQEPVLSCLAQGLSQLPISGLLLEPVAKDDRHLLALQALLAGAGFTCDYRFRDYNWIYRLHGKSYEEYMAERPAKLRNTISRKKRKLEREHGYDIRLFTGADAPGHMSDYYAVYNASWKQNEISNTDFTDNFIEKFSISGWTRLAILYVNYQPIAAQTWFVCHGKASIFRLAYDKAWRHYSPGSILTDFLMKYVIDTDKIDEIDFLTGNDFYKQDWMSERRERFLLGCTRSMKSQSLRSRFFGTLKRQLGK